MKPAFPGWLVEPFRLHDQGFTRELSGDPGAEADYKVAVASFHDLLCAPATEAALVARVRAYPPTRDSKPEQVVQTFLKCLPDWLLEAHLKRCAGAFADGDDARAGLHWDVIASCPQLGTKSFGHSVDDCRGFLQRNYLPEISEVPSRRRGQLVVAERLLRMDGLQVPVRSLVMRHYTRDVASALLDGSPMTGNRARRVKLSAGARSRLYKSGRRLEKHARRLFRVPLGAQAQRDVAWAFETLREYYRFRSDGTRMRMAIRKRRQLRLRSARGEGAIVEATDPERRRGAPTTYLERNPFIDRAHPYQTTPLTVLGVSAVASGRQIRQAERQRPNLKGSALTPAQASNLLSRPILRLVYDLMSQGERARKEAP